METQIRAIWDDLHGELEKFIRAKVKDEEDSRDILQEVFIKIQVNIGSLNDSSKLTSWVYQITRNTITDHFRKKNSTRTLSTDEIPDLAQDAAEEDLYTGLSRCINGKIAQLPDNYRQALLLTTFGDHSQQEASDKLNISLTATKTHVYRAKAQLKKLLMRCRNIAFDKHGKVTEHNFHKKNRS